MENDSCQFWTFWGVAFFLIATVYMMGRRENVSKKTKDLEISLKKVKILLLFFYKEFGAKIFRVRGL